MSDYVFDSILPQHSSDERLGTACLLNVRRSIIEAEKVRRSTTSNYANAYVVVAAPIIPQLSRLAAGGKPASTILIPATMRPKAPKRIRHRTGRLRRAWRILRGR